MHTPLYKLLQRQPSAPFAPFNKFAVGKINNLNADLIRRLNLMREGNEPSGGQLILGKNGNGKTLLNKSIQMFASSVNLQPMQDGVTPSFEIMFSRVSFHQLSSANIGVELAKNLRRSYKEPQKITYASIAAETLKRFSVEYKQNIGLTVLSWPMKIALKQAIKKYDEYINDVIELPAKESVGKGVDTVFKRLDKSLRFWGIHKGFRQYARSKKISAFLESYIGDGSREYRCVEELNKALHDDLAISFGKAQPIDVVLSISEMCKDVGCKVIIFEIDDCNDPKAIQFLLPISEYFEQCIEPKVFIIASGVTESWDANIKNDLDKSAQHKIQEYFNRIEIDNPTKLELQELANKLEALIQTEEAENGKALEWCVDEKEKAINECEGKSFRIATKKLIDSAEKYIR